jgi:RHS repeat-associated protein
MFAPFRAAGMFRRSLLVTCVIALLLPDAASIANASTPPDPNGFPSVRLLKAQPPMPTPKSGVGRYEPARPAATKAAAAVPAVTTAPAPREWFSPTTHYLRNDDGTVTASMYGGTAFRRDGRGGWKPTKASLVTSADTAWPLAAPDGYVPARFGRSARNLLALDIAGGPVVLSAPKLAVGKPAAAAGRMRYRDVATDTDLVFRPGAAQVKEEIVLRSAAAPRSFAFHLADPRGLLGDVTAEPDGSFRFSRSIGDGVYLGFAAPVAYEQSAVVDDDMPPASPGSAHLAVTKVRGGFDIVESVDKAWLAGKSYPIVLDPTTKTFSGSVSTDCYVVSDNYANQGNCGAGDIEVGNGLGGTPLGSCGTGSPLWCIRRGLLNFDTTAMPRGSDVTAASLRLWQFDNQTGDTFSVTMYNNNIAFTSAATWNRYNSTCTSPCWSGGATGTAQGTTLLNGSDAYRTFTFGSPNIVETWRNNTGNDGGVILRVNPEARSSIGTSGHVVDFYSNTVTDSSKWPLLSVTYNPPAAPVVNKTVAPAPGYATSQNGSYARGTVARFTVAATSAVGQDDVSITDTLPAGVIAMPETITVDGVACSTCLSGSTITKTLLDYSANQTHTIRYDAVLVGSDERDCVAAVNTATSKTTSNTTNTDTVTVTICDIGLGLEPWWSYFDRPVAYGSTAYVNAANGNLVVQQQDSTVVQGRGRLSYGLRRTYNSQDTRLLSLPGSMPAHWQLNFGEVADAGISPSGLVVPPLTTLSKTLPVTLIDRDGTRHVFTARSTTTPIQVMRLDSTLSPPALVPVSATLGPLVPSVLDDAVNLNNFNTVCADVAYAAPAGVHLSLWRYIALNNTGGATTCTQGSGTAAPVLLGYATERTDRYRNEFAWSGQLLSQIDATGNELRYAYTGGLPLAGGVLGKLSTVYEPGECTEAQATASGSTCRSFRMTYDPTSGMLATVTDPADGVTTYAYDTSFGFPQLIRVTNPDSSAIQYTYYDGDAATCTVTGQTPQRGELCSITDERGSVTKFRYNTATGGFPGKVNSIVDRRGTTTTFTYAADASSTDALVNGAHRRSWRLIDTRGRVGQVVDSETTFTYHQTDYTWDSSGCRKPSGGTDNDLCRVVRKAFNDTETGQAKGVDTADQDTSYTYNDEGNRLSESKVLDASTSLVTTYGYRAIYVQRSSVSTADDTVAGGAVVNSAARPAAAGVVYVLSDRTQSLTPRGNQPGLGTWSSYLTTYRVENNPAAQPNTAPPAPVPPNDPRDAVICTQADLTQPVTNTGLVCQIEAPVWDGTHQSFTRYSYDHFGAQRTMTSPKAVYDTSSPSATPPHTTYTYYDTGTTDVSTSTSAAGWLKGVTDPSGKFVAFAYDRAGHVIRTWDRNATSRGLAQSGANILDTYPTNGVGGYSETLYASSASAMPWRFVVSEADQLGNRTSYTLDQHGNRISIRPPRGNLANTSVYDTVQTFSAADDRTSRMTPEGRAAGNQKWRWVYDAYGNLFSESDPLADPDYPALRSDDPTGHTKRYIFDSVNRLAYVFWNRNPLTEPSAGGCSYHGLGAPESATHWGCLSQATFDGIDNQITTTNGESQVTRMHFDAVGREIRRDIPRTSTTTTRSEQRYDRDGNLTQDCSAREFDATEPNAALACVANGQYTTTYTYDVAGRKSQMQTHRGAATYVTTYQYNADGVQTALAGPAGRSEVYTVDLLGRRTRSAVLRGGTYFNTDYGYDAVGNTTSISRPGGRVTAYTFDLANRPLDTVEGADNVDATQAGATTADGGSNIRSSVRYDADGNVVARLEPRAFRTAAGAPATTVPATTSFMTRYDIDLDGRVVAEYRPRYDGTSEFADLGVTSAQSSQCTTPNRPAPVVGNPTDLPAYNSSTAVCVLRRSYDGAGEVTQLRLPTSNGTDNRYLSYTYTDDHLLKAVSAPSPADPSGGSRVTAEARTYDAVNRPLSVTRAAPVSGGTPYVSTTVYTSDGLVAQTTEGTTAHATTNTYDANGNVTVVQNALGQQTKSTYYSDDLLKDVTDAGLNMTSYTYDGAGNTTDVVSPNLQGTGLSVHSTYTADDLLASRTEPIRSAGAERRRTTYGYDAGGRKNLVTTDRVDSAGTVLEAGGSQSFGYYPSDRPASQTGRNGETITRTYDAAGHPATLTNTPATGSAVTTTVTSYLDGMTRTVTESGRTVSYAYDGSGAMAVRDINDGSHKYARYGYGDADQLVSATSDVIGAGPTFGFSYDAAGRETSRTNPDGTTMTRGYDVDNTLLTQQLAPTASPSSPITAWTYAYDPLFRETLAARDASGTPTCPAVTTSTLPATGVQCYYYDAAGRLDDFRTSTSDKDIGYDGNGNRIKYGTATFSYNLDNSLATDSSGTQYQYDAVGRLRGDVGKYLCYDGFDRLLDVRVGTTSCAGSNANGVVYAYDAMDRQTSATEIGASAVTAGTTTLHYDGLQSDLLAEAAPQNKTTSYVLVDGGPAYVTKSGGGGTSQYLTDDGRGNVSTATTTAGALACSLRYDPFGSPLGGQSGANPCSTGSTPSDVLFGGRRRDGVSGNYQLGSRTYDPAKAGFLTVDTYRAGTPDDDVSIDSDPLTANRYSFVNGDPVNFEDPTGHCRVSFRDDEPGSFASAASDKRPYRDTGPNGDEPTYGCDLNRGAGLAAIAAFRSRSDNMALDFPCELTFAPCTPPPPPAPPVYVLPPPVPQTGGVSFLCSVTGTFGYAATVDSSVADLEKHHFGKSAGDLAPGVIQQTVVHSVVKEMERQGTKTAASVLSKASVVPGLVSDLVYFTSGCARSQALTIRLRELRDAIGDAFANDNTPLPPRSTCPQSYNFGPQSPSFLQFNAQLNQPPTVMRNGEIPQDLGCGSMDVFGGQ